MCRIFPTIYSKFVFFTSANIAIKRADYFRNVWLGNLNCTLLGKKKVKKSEDGQALS